MNQAISPKALFRLLKEIEHDYTESCQQRQANRLGLLGLKEAKRDASLTPPDRNADNQQPAKADNDRPIAMPTQTPRKIVYVSISWRVFFARYISPEWN